MTGNRANPELLDPDLSIPSYANKLTTLRVHLNGWQATVVSLTRDELQVIVNAAATQYGVRPVCLCADPDDELDPDCPRHGSSAVNAATTQYGITPTVCTCYPGGFTPDTFEGPKEDCPIHGANRRCVICGATFANHNGYECIGDWFA